MATSSARLPLALAAAAGMVLWLLASLAAGGREAWDGNAYWTVAYPLAIAVCGVLGFYFPRLPWRWPVALFLTQFVTMVLLSGEVGNLAPLGAALFAVLAVPGIVLARLGARWGASRRGL